MNCFNILIFKDETMRENNIKDVVNRLQMTFNSNAYRNHLSNPKNNWLDITVDDAIMSVFKIYKKFRREVMIYFIADTHFNHANIIKYCNRPFKNTYEMNEYIIKKWNSVVKEADTVYHLGDVGFGSLQEVKSLVERLNGRKILLRGNHDFKIGVNTWKEIGFLEVYKKKIILDNLLLTHAPTEEVEENQINIFGHIHDKPLDERFNKKNHICVSCDVVDYIPVSISKN